MRQIERNKVRAAGRAGFVLDALEPRRLFSGAAEIAEIDWRGQQIEMVRGEWIVGLTTPNSTYDENTGEVIYDGVRSYATTPSASLKLAMDAAEKLGVAFQRYLGSEDVFLVKVPDGVSYEQLTGVMDDVPEFQYVEPNGIGRFGWMVEPIPYVPLDEVPTTAPNATGTDATEQPTANALVIPTKPTFSQDRIRGANLLDSDGDDDLLK